MEVPQIFGQSNVCCFYRSITDLVLLPKGINAASIENTKAYNPAVCTGYSPIYDKYVQNYDPSITLETFRNKIANGEDLETSDYCINAVTIAKPIQYTTAETEKITRLRNQIKSQNERKNKLINRNANNRLISNANRELNRITGMLDAYTAELAHKYSADGQSQPSEPKKIIKKNPNFGVDSASDISDDISDEEEVIVTEESELTEVREELFSERMGRNRPEVIHRLKTELNRMESTSSTPIRHFVPMSEDEVFSQLAILRWADKDEHKMTSSVLNKIPLHKLNSMFPVMTNMANVLREALATKTGVVENMDDADRMNFLFHVIAKGRELYYQSLIDADFCLYLVDGWQPLHTYIQEKINR
jgi:hypothetical protein